MKNLLFNAFYQGKDEESTGAGNCASVALIKAAMYTYGFEVFDYTLQNALHVVKLKNGETIEFTTDELTYASKEARFVLGKPKKQEELKTFNEIRNYAYLCFTVICKMAQKYGDFSSRYSKFIIPDNFELAVEIINDGTFTPDVYEFLGLEDLVSPTYRMRLKKHIRNKKGMVMWTKSHAMFASNGYIDLYGKKVKFRGRFMVKLPGKIAAGVFKVLS